MAELTNTEKGLTGVIGVLLVLAGLGGSQFLTQSEYDNTFVCPLNENVGVFHRLSGTAKTGYYYLEDGSEKGVGCRSGYTYAAWENLDDYAKERGLDPLSFIVQQPTDEDPVEPDIPVVPDPGDVPAPAQGAKRWKCSVDGCVAY